MTPELEKISLAHAKAKSSVYNKVRTHAVLYRLDCGHHVAPQFGVTTPICHIAKVSMKWISVLYSVK